MTAPDRPTIAPAAAAALLAAVPSRLIKKLDAAPDQAAAWRWAATGDGMTVTSPTGETVHLPATVARAEDVRCSCLLGPRCLHVAAVVSLLAPSDPSLASPGVVAVDPIAPSVTLDPAQLDAAARAWTAAAILLATGADASGTAAQAGLLRAIHGCRAAGLHRAAAGATRVLAQVRELRADRPEFVLSQLTADLRELLLALRGLRGPAATAAMIGTARRRYEPIGGLRLFGVFSDAVVARSGYAGVVTYLTDGTGRVFTVSDVAPGHVERAVASYDAPADIGDATLSHRELGRSGLFLAAATASRDGRLGAGKDVKAVRAAESPWSEPAIAGLWRPSLADQLARLAAAAVDPIDHRPAGWDLVFVTGELVVSERVLALRLADASVIQLAAATDHADLRHRDNLIALAAHRGHRVHVVGRARLDRPRTLALLAVGAVDGAESIIVPAAAAGRINLAFERLGSTGVTARAAAIDPPPIAAVPDPLVALRRRIDRIGLAGAATLPPEAGDELHREALALERRLLPGAAVALRTLAATAATRSRQVDGRHAAVDPDRFATAWLGAAVYVDAADRRIARAVWLGDDPA